MDQARSTEVCGSIDEDVAARPSARAVAGLLRDIVASDRFRSQRYVIAVTTFVGIYVLAAVRQVSATDYGRGWFDQGMYLRSARALAAGNLDPALHWYPPLYSLLAAPFVKLLPSAPFLVVNLASFVLAIVMFLRICTRFDVPHWLSIPVLAISLLVPSLLLFQFVIPWTTIPVAGLTLVGLHAAVQPGAISRRQLLSISAVSALVPLFRPADVLMLIPVWVAVLARLRERGLGFALRLVAEAAAVAFAILGAYAALHLSIYGTTTPPYLAVSSRVGLDFSAIWVKAFALFVDPQPLYGVGTAILVKIPWLLIFPFGAVVMVWRFGWRGAVAPAMALISLLIYVAYVDMTPFSFWGQLNYHYYSSAFLIAAICCAVAVKEVIARPYGIIPAALIGSAPFFIAYRVDGAAGSVAVEDSRTISLSCNRCEPYRAVEIPGVRLHPFDIYQGSGASDAELHEVAAGGHLLRNIRNLRFIPQPGGGVRLVFPNERTDQRLVVRFAMPHGLIKEAAIRPSFLHGHLVIALPR